MNPSQKETLQQLYQQIASGNRAQVKTARKKLEKEWERLRKNKPPSWRKHPFFKEIMEAAKEIGSPSNLRAYLSSLRKFCLLFFKQDPEYFQKFTLRFLQHENGNVREGIRHASYWLKINVTLTGKDGNSQIRKRHKDFLYQIAELIKQNQLTEKTTKYVENLDPSVYKSLILFWHDMNYRVGDKRWISQNA